ncbi:MAG TPA: hypothetical protein VGG25_31190 [Streptosporangiaceae bacterium]|jgi:hypothetical protein
MAGSTSWVLAAGGIAAANEALFVPAETGKAPDFGSVWRILPATGLLAVGLALLGQAVPGFATGIAKLLVVGVLVFPVGNAPTPLQNAAKLAKGVK